MTSEAVPITALIYADSVLADQALRQLVRQVEAARHWLAGVVRRDTPGAFKP